MRVLLVVLLLTAGCRAAGPIAPFTPEPLPGYTPAPDDERHRIMLVIDDYYALRAGAAETGDTSRLFQAYPRLAVGEDRSAGINTDAWFVERMREYPVLRMTFCFECDGIARVYIRDDRAVVFIHGTEMWRYPRGDATIGEFLTRIDLVREAGAWTLVRTDEVMLHEYHR